MGINNFFEIDRNRHIGETLHFFLIRDGFPVSPGHTLIITKALREDYFELTQEEKADLDNAIQLAKKLVEEEFAPDGYNIGMNCGETAGQTVFHFHCHLIPRFSGDMEDPRGGVRYVIPSKGSY
ncbi:HIT family protein [Sphingobacterium sp. UT-1RO-CII-1]|uniref:HIT family protein n=1 Tax=Sphingobacterium sp. UT-1RO-CII-1 TaxID=2995225 RepID=UPI00227AE8CC|nr:HIT family protein [Sphingobacterium sp. UT-1RO-CII-1]MCY4780370.1 HIT family protein [Sphingobacterium sp. UT-1RO-CII-1]